MGSLLWILLGLLVMTGVVSFFLLVALVPTLEVAVVGVGLALMFLLGMRLGLAQALGSESEELEAKPVHRRAA